MLHHLAVSPGDQVLHVGAGTGYYTAILAELAGPGGRIMAVEYEPALADAARKNLLMWPNVLVICGDGAAYPTEPTQRIYVNFATGQPADAWLDHLTIGGRLVFPLGVPHPRAHGESRHHTARGAALRVTRMPAGYAVHYVSAAHFICAEGLLAGDRRLQDALFDAFESGDVATVASLRRGESPREHTWFWSPRWSLSHDPPPNDSLADPSMRI
jgi:protein-L-isoaspartate(D-aspartate) O-methyltransferase